METLWVVTPKNICIKDTPGCDYLLYQTFLLWFLQQHDLDLNIINAVQFCLRNI